MNTTNDSNFEDKDPIKTMSELMTLHKDKIYKNFSDIFKVLGTVGMKSESTGFEREFAKPILNILSKTKESIDKLYAQVDAVESKVKIIEMSAQELELYRKELIKILGDFNSKFEQYVLTKQFLVPAVIHPFSSILKEIDEINYAIENFSKQITKEIGSVKGLVKEHKESIDPLPEDMSDEIDQMLGTSKNDTKMGIDSILDQFSRGEISKDQMNQRMKEFANSIGNLTRKSSVIVPIQGFGTIKLK